jgi:hypothetical protein
MRKLGAFAVAVACAALVQAVALGAGPSPGLSQNGIASGKVRYVAAIGDGTTLELVRRAGGQILHSKTVPGSWGIPLVSFDGTAGGLSADGRMLILSDTNGVNPQAKRTSFLAVATKSFRVLRTIRLKGSWSFDALSPDSRRMYLIEHLYNGSGDPTHYRVRAYDLRAHRLLARVISDKTTWETDMQGMPISRLSHAGWEYTLYGAAGPRPFIHALDTRHATAVCIDMPWKYQPDKVFKFRLRLDGDGHLVVRGPRGRALAVVDPQEKRVLSFVRDP